jgi:hypothetical protein
LPKKPVEAKSKTCENCGEKYTVAGQTQLSEFCIPCRFYMSQSEEATMAELNAEDRRSLAEVMLNDWQRQG